MIELFPNVKQEVRDAAAQAWAIAKTQSAPQAAEFLSTVTKYYTDVISEEDGDFLNFYFNMKMMEETKS